MNEEASPMGATNAVPAPRSLAELRAFGKATAKQAGGQTVQEPAFTDASLPRYTTVPPVRARTARPTATPVPSPNGQRRSPRQPPPVW